MTDRPPILTPAFDAFALDHGWQLLRIGETPALEDGPDVFVFGAVPWSGWDRRASQALAAYTDQNPTVRVVVFNVDDYQTSAQIQERLPGAEIDLLQVPIIARYRSGVVDRLEQGMPAVHWIENLTRH